ncbi:MAG: serine/threonine-protein kinase [Kofleriaceae bacterium]
MELRDGSPHAPRADSRVRFRTTSLLAMPPVDPGNSNLMTFVFERPQASAKPESTHSLLTEPTVVALPDPKLLVVTEPTVVALPDPRLLGLSAATESVAPLPPRTEPSVLVAKGVQARSALNAAAEPSSDPAMSSQTEPFSMVTARFAPLPKRRTPPARLDPAEAMATVKHRKLKAARPTQGTVSLGRYQLVSPLASGSTSHVFLARLESEARPTRHLVVKTLRRQHVYDQGHVAAFHDEARLFAAMHHRNLAQVLEVALSGDGTHYLAMEYLHGFSVRAVLDQARSQGARLPMDFALTVVASAAAGLQHAAERHGGDARWLKLGARELSPSSLTAVYSGVVKITSFGTAKASAHATRTPSEANRDRLRYLTPEHTLGKPVDARSDVFALGTLLYELTTQVHPFAARTEQESKARVVRAEPQPPSQLVADYPPGLDAIILKALAKRPAERFEDCGALGRALVEASGALGLALGPTPIQQTLSTLFGVKPEPWLEVAGADEAAPTQERRAPQPPADAAPGAPRRRLRDTASVPAVSASALPAANPAARPKPSPRSTALPRMTAPTAAPQPAPLAPSGPVPRGSAAAPAATPPRPGPPPIPAQPPVAQAAPAPLPLPPPPPAPEPEAESLGPPPEGPAPSLPVGQSPRTLRGHSGSRARVAAEPALLSHAEVQNIVEQAHASAWSGAPPRHAPPSESPARRVEQAPPAWPAPQNLLAPAWPGQPAEAPAAEPRRAGRAMRLVVEAVTVLAAAALVALNVPRVPALLEDLGVMPLELERWTSVESATEQPAAANVEATTAPTAATTTPTATTTTTAATTTPTAAMTTTAATTTTPPTATTTTPTATTTTPTATTTTAAGPVEPTPPTTYRLRVTSEPSGATVSLDGVRLGRTPLDLEQPMLEGAGVLRLRRGGYRSKKLEIARDADLALDVRLDAEPAASNDGWLSSDLIDKATPPPPTEPR